MRSLSGPVLNRNKQLKTEPDYQYRRTQFNETDSFFSYVGYGNLCCSGMWR
jgi:hypothetical protein